MSVTDEQVALLSNYEVFSLLKEVRQGNHGKRKRSPENLATIVYETSKYLEKTPCKDQSPDIVQNFLKALQPFKLTKAEKLQLLNLRPATDVEFYLIIAECEERFSQTEIKAIMDIVHDLLPGAEEENETAAGDERGGEDA